MLTKIGLWVMTLMMNNGVAWWESWWSKVGDHVSWASSLWLDDFVGGCNPTRTGEFHKMPLGISIVKARLRSQCFQYGLDDMYLIFPGSNFSILGLRWGIFQLACAWGLTLEAVFAFFTSRSWANSRGVIESSPHNSNSDAGGLEFNHQWPIYQLNGMKSTS